MKSKKSFRSQLVPVFLTFILLGPALRGEVEEKSKKKENPAKITEEILVVGKLPRELPIFSVTSVDTRKIDQVKPVDLSETIRYSPGALVTFGEKNEYTLKLRGMDSKRIALLVDGVPVYEPYYSTFDLKTISTQGAEALQITRGSSSVLYGPNTLGGIVNVITRRPEDTPGLSLSGSYGEKNTRGIGIDSALRTGKFAFLGNFLYQDSDGYRVPAEDGSGSVDRANSDYRRINFGGKAYYTPNDRSEFLVSGNWYRSDYGMAPALSVVKARYWQFKDWDRTSLSAGGYTALGRHSTLRFRAFYVNYFNIMDQFKNAAMTVRQFESTFDNTVWGIFGLTDIFISPANSLKLSVNHQGDKATQQDDVNLPWIEYTQGTTSIGVEDHHSLSDSWRLIGGVSIDYLDKYLGKSTSRVNPLLGVKFTPGEFADIHVSVSRKSKFPSMRSLYSQSSGNPDLLSEAGTNAEIGFTYNRHFYLSGSAFLYKFRDMIDSYRLPDGTRRFLNIGRVHINGFELQAQKTVTWGDATLNYTFLDHRNESDDRPLDNLPKHSLNFTVNALPLRNVRLGLMGLLGSESHWLDSTSGKLLSIPSYFNLDAILSFQLKRFEIFAKLGNVFDHYFYTDPGFPWRGRYFEVGFRANVIN